MSDYVYTYSIENDFPGGKVNTSKLHAAIQQSAIITALDFISTVGDVLTINFKAQLSDGDKTILDGNATGPAGGLIASTDNTDSAAVVQPVLFADTNGNPIPANVDADGTPRFVQAKTNAQKFNAISPNWCDKTTWYERSVQVTNETLTDSGNGLLFNSVNPFWIDAKHGRIFNEDVLIASNSGKWICSVTANSVLKHENSPGQTDKDFTVNYAAGTITFNGSVSGQTILATYWYSPATAGNSTWTVIPPAGMKIQLLRVELQFSVDIILKDTAVFQPLGYVQVFAPQYCPVPYPLNTLIPLGEPIKYKSMADFVSESNGAYPRIPAFGGNDQGGWRNLGQDIITLVWDYIARTDIHSSYGMQLQTALANDIPHGGTFATATFYCIQIPED